MQNIFYHKKLKSENRVRGDPTFRVKSDEVLSDLAEKSVCKVNQ